MPVKKYNHITERILAVSNKYKSILFAASGRNFLPLTVPANVAIQLAAEKKRCLLIDLDLERDAVARAFEIDVDPNSLQPKAVKTPIERLWIWPGHNFTQIKHMNIKALVQAATERFDCVLLNAPCLTASPDRRQIVSAAQAAIVFGKEDNAASELDNLIKGCNCELIERIELPVGTM